jgi:CTP:molybdopterin cytidylyltransferase MocA
LSIFNADFVSLAYIEGESQYRPSQEDKMKITEAQLRKIVRQEYVRNHSMRRSLIANRQGNVMTEARARHIANEVINEGLFSTIKAGFSALMKGGGVVADKLGDKATAALQPVAKAITAAAKRAGEVAAATAAMIRGIKDDAVRAAVEEFQESLKTSLSNSLKTQIQEGIQDLTNAGIPEEEAKNLVATITTSVLSELSQS